MTCLDDQELWDRLNEALSNHHLTKEEANAIFDKVDATHEEFQRRLKASKPTQADRERVYDL